jgi:hypothetical protein
VGVAESRRSIVLLLASVVLAVVATAVALALTGRTEAAVKVALFAFLLLATLFTAALVVDAVTTPGWFRRAETVLGAVVFGAMTVFGLAFLIWLPFSPFRWRFEEMPAILRVPMLAGLTVFAVGSLAGLVYAVPAAWRRGDRRRAAEYLLALGIMAWVIASVASRRPYA